MKKTLLGSTALAGALVLAAPQAHALDVILGGFLGFEVIGATENRLNGSFDKRGDNGSSDRGYQFATDTEVIVRAQGTTDGGTIYGAKIELEGDITTTQNADEVGLFFSGGFGRIELGADDGAEDVMMLDATTIAAGTGGIDGTIDLALGTQVDIGDSGDAVKATYFTPRVAGFQAGVSFTPDTGDQGDNERLTGNQNGDVENSVGLGLNFVTEFGWGDLGLAAVGFLGQGEDTRTPQQTGLISSTDDAKNVGVGGTLGFGNLSFGGSFLYNDDLNEGTAWTAGVGYSFGAINTSFTYNGVRPEDNSTPDTADRDIFVLSADTGLMPGVTLAGDVGYALYSDESTTDNGGYDSNDFVAGVVKLNLAF